LVRKVEEKKRQGKKYIYIYILCWNEGQREAMDKPKDSSELCFVVVLPIGNIVKTKEILFGSAPVDDRYVEKEEWRNHEGIYSICKRRINKIARFAFRML